MKLKVSERTQGVEVQAEYSAGGTVYTIAELLTIQEAEDLAHQLLDAARECRMNKEELRDLREIGTRPFR